MVLSMSLGQFEMMIPAMGYNEAQASENVASSEQHPRVKNAKKDNLPETKQKLSTDLLKLIDNTQMLPGEDRAQIVSKMKREKQYIGESDAVSARSKKAHVAHGELVKVYVKMEATATTVAIDNSVWEVTGRDEENHLAVALVEVNKLEALTALTEVRAIKAVTPPHYRQGSVTAEGDVAHKTAEVRSTYGKNGAGIKIGVISDGVNSWSQARSSGDLPANLNILDDGEGDEGTAMLEIIYDMAPGASLYFASDNNGDIVEFNAAIDKLVAAGCKIIVDDVGYDDEPFFEDGPISTKMTSIMASKGIIFISAAGNEADCHQQTTYSDNGSGQHSKPMYATMWPDEDVYVVLQWNDKWGSSANDYDLAIYDTSTGERLAESTETQDGSSDPYEWLGWVNDTGGDVTVEIVVENYDAAQAKIIELYVWSYETLPTNVTPADSIWGHPSAKGVIAVGAIDAQISGWSTAEVWSSQGPSLVNGELRAKPEIAGLDNVQVTGVGDFGSPFGGTSASAPAIGGVVAQLWGAFPAMKGSQIQDALLAAAVDCGASGYDYIYGFGRADAMRSYQMIALGIMNGNTATDVTTFTAGGVAATVNNSTGAITLTFPAGTNLTSIAPTIAVSPGATVTPASGSTQNLTNPVTYTVTAQDGTSEAFTVQATVETPNLSSEKNITSFNLKGVAGTINNTAHTIAVTLPSGTSVTSIAPTITVSTGATVSPTSGAAKNFTSPVTYTVTAANGSTQTYKVTVTVTAAAESSEKAITSFVLKGEGGTIDETNHTIAITFPAGTSVTSLAPTITVSDGATISPTSGTAKNFTSPVTYTVTAENGSTQTYKVTVTVETANLSSVKNITSFVLKGVSGTINNTTHTIAVTLPTGTSVTSIAPTITVSTGATVSPTSGTAKSFSSPVTYTVTAADGSTQTYKVTVTVEDGAALSSAKNITTFTLIGVAGIINNTSRTITVNLPTGTSVTSLAPTIVVSGGASISPISGTSKNFSVPAVYTVTAEDGSTQSYVVSVNVASADASSEKKITAFILGGKTGIINEAEHSITVNLPAGTNVTALEPDIYLSVRASVSPASGSVKNYTNPVNYIMTAEDGSIQAYVVTVNVGAPTGGSPVASVTYNITGPTSNSVVATLVPSETVTVTSTGGFTHTFTQNETFTFTFKDSDGNTGSVIAKVSNIDKTPPTITLKGSAVINLTVGATYSESGVTAEDNLDGTIGIDTKGTVKTNTAGTYIVTYTATDSAGNTATVTRTVTVGGGEVTGSENSILTFAFRDLEPDIFGIIDEVNHNIAVTVPVGANLAALVPTIRTTTGATVSPASGVAQNFSTAKTYTVTSAAGAKQAYTVTVKKAGINLPAGIVDGDIIQCKTSANSFAVYIVKIVGDKLYIRHIVSLEIFNYYKHLKWENLKQVTSLEPYSLSGWVRANTGANGTPRSSDKVWEVNGDQTKHWINMTAQQFLTHGGSDEAIYTVNQGELNLYKQGADVMSL